MQRKAQNKNSKNARSKGNSFELLADELVDNAEQSTTSSLPAVQTRSRSALKRTQPIEPNSPPTAKRTATPKHGKTSPPPRAYSPPRRSPSPSSRSSSPLLDVPFDDDDDEDPETITIEEGVEELRDNVMYLMDKLRRVHKRAFEAEKKLDFVYKFIGGQFMQQSNQIQTILNKLDSFSPSSSSSPPPTIPTPPPHTPPKKVPGIGLDISRVENKDIDAGKLRELVDEALKEKDIQCLGINDKGNGRYRLLFREDQVDQVRRDNGWLRDDLSSARLFGEQWYPIRVDRVLHSLETGNEGCRLFGKLNNVTVHKMRFLGKGSEGKEYRSMVVYLDTQEEVARLLKGQVLMPNGECAFTHEFVKIPQPPRCYRCHAYGHLHYRCQSPTPFCGQCSLPGHSALGCTSTSFRCVACKGPHKVTDLGCPVYRQEVAKAKKWLRAEA